MIFKIAKFLQNFTNTSEELAEFEFKSLVAELVDFVLLFDHFFKFVEVDVCFEQLSQRLHACGVNLAHFGEGSFDVLSV